MNYAIYEKAKKAGDKAYKQAVSKGHHPYLPVLDEIIDRENISGEVSLGLIDVPLDRIVGTATAGRTQAFASNFMPIMDEKTEFGSKWSALSEAHLEEGIHDPIKVYEYLNYYYVIEGNKRVSVLKYFDADSVPAFVTRKIPKLTDDPEIRLYYEFMDFNKKTRVNFVWFSREGSFEKLLELVGVEAGAEGRTEEKTVGTISDSGRGEGAALRQEAAKLWSEDTFLEFKSAYFRFSKIFKEKGGEKLSNITTGDAFLRLIEVNEFDAVTKMTDTEISETVSSMWQEFMVINVSHDVEVSLDPPDEKKGILSYFFTPSYSETNPLKVAFIYDREPQLSDWLYQHELGRLHIKNVFGDKIETFKVTTAGTEEDAILSITDLVEREGVNVIFTTTPRLVDASLKCAIKYPDVKILNCSLNTSHRYIRTYYTRLYEAKFISGMVAGALTETHKIGYFADYPIFGIPANINAFAIGARMVNPHVKVVLKWTTTKDTGSRDDIYKSFYDEGIDYLSDQDMITPKKASRRFGMYKLTGNAPENYTMSVNNWGKLYERMINIIYNGGWDAADAEGEGKAINYWWGLSAGVIDVILSDKVPHETARLARAMAEMIRYDKISPFEGKILSQDLSVKNEENNRMKVDDIIRMDWLVDNVIGEIPAFNNLKERAKQIVELKGVRKENENPDNR